MHSVKVSSLTAGKCKVPSVAVLKVAVQLCTKLLEPLACPFMWGSLRGHDQEDTRVMRTTDDLPDYASVDIGQPSVTVYRQCQGQPFPGAQQAWQKISHLLLPL